MCNVPYRAKCCRRALRIVGWKKETGSDARTRVFVGTTTEGDVGAETGDLVRAGIVVERSRGFLRAFMLPTP